MADINQLLQNNSFKVKQLLRRSRIVGEPTIENIRKGFDKHGEPFMLKLLEIIGPSEASFSSLITPKSAVLSTAPVDTKTLMPTGTQPSTEENGKFWSFWDKLLSGVGQTGEALGKFKSDVATSPTQQVYTPDQLAQQASNTKLLYMAAFGFVFLIIIFLIIRR